MGYAERGSGQVKEAYSKEAIQLNPLAEASAIRVLKAGLLKTIRMRPTSFPNSSASCSSDFATHVPSVMGKR